MTMRDIEKDLELCEAASKGPWKVKTNRHRNTDGTSWGWVEGTREGWCWSKSRNKSYEDAAFIAAARTALPYWLGEVKRLRELTDALGDEVLGANADLAKANIALRAENERLRSVLSGIYPAIAGRVIALEQAGETVAHGQWAEMARKIYKALEVSP